MSTKSRSASTTRTKAVRTGGEKVRSYDGLDRGRTSEVSGDGHAEVELDAPEEAEFDGEDDDTAVIDQFESSLRADRRTWTIDSEVTTAVRYTLNRWALSSEDPLPGVAAVVSALPGEGVTTVSRALATLLNSDFGGRVCCLDLSSSAATDSEADGRPGVWEVLRGTSTLDEALVGIGRDGLYTLAAGSAFAGDRHALVHGPEMEELMADLRDKFDFVVIDAPPVSSDADSLAMMRLVDAYLLVVRHGSTSTTQIRSAVEELRTVPSIGAILNGYRTRTPRFIRRILSM